MSMKEWAESEIAIACKRERGDAPEGEWDYGCACYESAYKAFLSLLEDEHSGMSIGFTKAILNRLIDGKPLTPIEDTPDVWNEVGDNQYQCKRMSSLFKDVSGEEITYNDVNRFICIGEDGISYHSGLVSRVMREKYPVTMPYYPPDKPYVVRCEDFLVDPKNGDFDTVGIYYMKTPEGDIVHINRYFTEGGDLYGCWKEISWLEYEVLRGKRVMR